MATVTIPSADESLATPTLTQRPGRPALFAALALSVLCTVITALASRSTSTTFDEIVLMAGGARGYESGEWDIAPDHPPLMQYLYGLPIWLSGPQLPPHRAAPDWRNGALRDFSFRYGYAREFFWAAGNDPERMAFLGRSVGAVLAGLLVFVVFLWTRRLGGDLAGLMAAALVAFLPDVLAHGGVAYNDVPLALGYLLAIRAIDAAVRRPGIGSGLLAGASVALAIGVKFSAVTLGPAALLILGAELMTRRGDAGWRRAIGRAVLAGMVGMYLGLVLIYRGDFLLAEMRYGLSFTFGHVSQGHGAPGYLLGRTSVDGWWYFFPVAFLFKTPAALHILLLAAIITGVRWLRREGVMAFVRSGARGAALGLLAFGGALLTSNLNIGFRYALPALPFVCMLVALGVARLRTELRGAWRFVPAAALVWYIGSTLSFYPQFLGYISEYGPGRDRGDEVLLDSSLDWGQGLLALRDWMRANQVDRVYLSYFGSGWPAGYGIGYVPLPSFFPLLAVSPPPADTPRYAVISATNLHGIYLAGDPFARFRDIEPDTVLAHSLKVYRIDGRTD